MPRVSLVSALCALALIANHLSAVDSAPARENFKLVSGGSHIDSHHLSLVHVGEDYAIEGASGCTSCGGGGADEVGPLPTFHLRRIHRYLDLEQRSSLGPGVFFNYDLSLSCGFENGHPIATYFDPEQSSESTLTDPNATGVLTDAELGAYNGLRFYDASHAQVANHLQATTAELRTHEGQIAVFELIRTDPSAVSQERDGRLVAYLDRNGNAIAITYVDAAGATDAALASDRSRLWRIATIGDAHDHTATFTYASAPIAGRWAVSRVDLPNGQHLTYTYGLSNLVGLNRVDHPDGNVTTIKIDSDNASQATTVIFDDATASGQHRRGTVLFTRLAFFQPKSRIYTGQPADRVRELLNGQGEPMYLNAVSRDPNDGSFTVLEYVGAVTVGHTTTATGDPGRDFWVLRGPSTLTPGKIYPTVDAHHNPLSVTDELGRTTTYQRDPATNAITSTRFPDGTVETTTYNPFNEPLLFTDRLGRQTQYAYDAAGNLIAKTVASGTAEAATWRWAYGESGSNARPGQPSSATDANGNVTRYVYDGHGYLQDVIEPKDFATDAVNPTRHSHHDAAGRLDQSTDEAGRTTTFAYDACNRVVLTSYGDSSNEAVGYGTTASETAGLRVWSRDRNGNHTIYQYDSSGRLVTTLSGLTLLAGHTSSASTADYANLASASVTARTYKIGTEQLIGLNTNGEQTDIAYDDLGQEINRTRTNLSGVAIAEVTAYDAAHRVDSRTTSIGSSTWSTYYVYDAIDRIVRTIRETAPSGAGSWAPAQQRPNATRALSANAGYLIDDQQYDGTPATTAYTPSSVVADAVFEVRIATDPRGIRHLRAYDHQGRLVEEVEAFGTADETRTAHQYDAQGNCLRTWLPRQFTEAGGFSTAYTYTGRNLVATMVEAEGRAEQATTATTYTPTGRPATVTVASGTADTATTTYGYGVCCDRLVQVQDGEGFITTYGYDFVGNLTSVTDPLLHTTQTAYDARNRVVSRIDPVHGRTSYVYDDNLLDNVGLEVKYPTLLAGVSLQLFTRNGAAVEITDATGKASVAVIDPFGRIVRRIDANGKSSSVGYESIGSVAGYSGGLIGVSSVDGLGNTVYAYSDGQHRPIGTVDAENRSTLFQLDANGNRIGVVDRDGHTTTCVYDNRDRCTSCTDAVNVTTRTAFDAAGNVVSMQDGLSKITQSAYDGRNRKIAAQDRIGGVTQFAYDRRNNLTGLVDAEGKATVYTYDRRNLLTSESFPPPTGGTRLYDYDAAGRLAHRTDQTSAVTAYEYDGANRLLFRHYPDGKDDSFAYDLDGRLTHATSARYANSVDRVYDPTGRLTSETQTIAGTAYAVSYAYDDANRKTHISYPGGDTVDRTYTARNQLQQLKFNGAEVAYRQYDPEMLLTSTRYLGGVTTETRGYFNDNQLHTIAAPGITSLTYAYSADKSALSESDGILTAQSQTFGYDDEQRLTTWSRTSGDSQTWTLTPVGDWSGTTVDGVAESRVHSNVHELTSITRGGTTFPLSYDAKGNLTVNQDGSQYGWDIENRLGSATISDPVEGVSDVATYEYDALGRRVRKTAWGETTTFLYDGAQVIREFDAPQQLAASAASDDGNGSGAPPGGGILPNALVRVNFQPSLRAIPPGFVADKGKVDAARTNGYSYGWDVDRTADAVSRGVHPLPQYDTFVRMASNAAAPGTWTITLPNGTYPIVVVMGDAISRHQTNNVVIQGIAETDPDPYDPNETQGYLLGDFDGYAELVTVSNGLLTIQVGSGAIDPKLCFIEIGHNGDPLDQATKDKLAAQVGSATQRTGGTAFPKPQPSPREYAYGSYVDEVVSYIAAGTRYAVTANRQYSPSALVDASGNVVERYAYDAYGQRTVLSAAGTTIGTDSTVAFERGYTGLKVDRETSLLYARTRWLDTHLGRWIARDVLGYPDGLNAYAAYFVPNKQDPYGACEVYQPNGPPPPVLPHVQPRPAGTTQFYGPDPNPPDPREKGQVAVPINGATPWVLQYVDRGSYAYHLSVGYYEGYAAAIEFVAADVLAARALGSLAELINAARAARAGCDVSNPVPDMLARAYRGTKVHPLLGPVNETGDVFVTAADDIAGLGPDELAARLGIDPNESFVVIKFPAPESGIASPINRESQYQLFVRGGKTIGGAREFVIPNGPVPSNSTVVVVTPSGSSLKVPR